MKQIELPPEEVDWVLGNLEYLMGGHREVPPMGVAREVPEEYFERFEGVLPATTLYIWQRVGFEGFGQGRFWITDPLEWEPVVDAWLDDFELPFPEQKWWCLTRTAMGRLNLWGEVSGPALQISCPNGEITPNSGNARDMDDPVIVERMGCVILITGHVDFFDMGGQLLVDQAFRRLGPLAADQVYGYVPPAWVTGDWRAERLSVQEAIPHLLFLAQSAPRQLGPDWSADVDAAIDLLDLDTVLGGLDAVLNEDDEDD